MAGLGLLGAAIAGGVQGAGRIAENYMREEGAARLEAQKQAADEQRQNTINQLNKEAEERRLAAQQGQWDVQNKSTAASLAIKQQQMENEAANQRGLLGIRMQEAGKQSAAEMEYRERSDIANRLSAAQEGTPEYRALTVRAKALGMLANEKEPTVSVKVANEDGTFRTITGPKSQVDALTGTPGPRNYGGGAGADGFGTQGTQAALDEQRNASAAESASADADKAKKDADRKAVLMNADPRYRAAQETLAGNQAAEEKQAASNESAKKTAQVQRMTNKVNAAWDLYERAKNNPGVYPRGAEQDFLKSFIEMRDQLAELNGGQ